VNLRTLALGLILATTFIAPLPTQAQGCAQCRDNAAATPPATQRAYRRAIILLTITAGGVFVAAVTALKHQR
jgi:hypothetical protein